MSRRSVLTTVNVPDCIDCREPLTFLRSVRRVSHVGGWGGMPRHARRRHSRILAHDGRGRCRLGGASKNATQAPTPTWRGRLARVETSAILSEFNASTPRRKRSRTFRGRHGQQSTPHALGWSDDSGRPNHMRRGRTLARRISRSPRPASMLGRADCVSDSETKGDEWQRVSEWCTSRRDRARRPSASSGGIPCADSSRDGATTGQRRGIC
jgi:hypothetical protein